MGRGFAEKIAKHTQGQFFIIYQDGDDLLDYYDVVVIPEHKVNAFTRDIGQKHVRLGDYGRFVHHGSGRPDAEQVAATLKALYDIELDLEM